MGAYEGYILRNVVQAFSAPASSGDNTLLAVPATKRIRVLSAIVSVGTAGANNVQFKTGSTTTTPLIVLAASGNYQLGYNPAAWILGALGEDLIINLSAATAVGVNYSYILLDS